MANKSLIGISLLAYASWQTLHFLTQRGHRVWARQRFFRYLPRPTKETIKKGRSCHSCIFFDEHPDFQNAGNCHHPGWASTMNSPEVLVKRAGSCELWCKTSPHPVPDKALSPDLFPSSAPAFVYPLH